MTANAGANALVFAHISDSRSENNRMRKMLSRDTRTHSSGSAFPKLCAQLSIFRAASSKWRPKSHDTLPIIYKLKHCTYTVALTYTNHMHTYITYTSLNPVVQLSTSYVKSFEIDNLPNREKTDREGENLSLPMVKNIHKKLAF